MERLQDATTKGEACIVYSPFLFLFWFGFLFVCLFVCLFICLFHFVYILRAYISLFLTAIRRCTIVMRSLFDNSRRFCFCFCFCFCLFLFVFVCLPTKQTKQNKTKQ